jgi:energy-coupling factor transporter ATP-binding protein EcfA2
MFGKLANKLGKQTNSSFIYLGAPEAEAEALPNSKVPLNEVYEDFHNLISALSNEKFIVVGRKGSGKSAFAEHIASLANEDSNTFCKFIRQGESNLEHIVQIGKESGHLIERENLYKWLILTNLLKLFTDNLAVSDNKDYQLLAQFLKKNSGYINIKESEIKELVKKRGFEVDINFLKRFAQSRLNKTIEIRQERAPFYKLIPHLRDVVLNVLMSHSERENSNSYVIFFDDLDISFDANNTDSVEAIISLLRVTKEINNEFFAKNSLDSKVVILLRDDICKSIASKSSDTAKIFSSYSATINWYQDEYHQTSGELALNIRRFINKRIRYAFGKENFEFNQQDPWLSLVQDPFIGISKPESKTSFKYILDHTLFRPRDLLLFFKPLASHTYKLPLNKQDVHHLIGRYSEELVNELKNELSCFYSGQQINMIFNALGAIQNECNISNNYCSYESAKIFISENCNDIDADSLLSDLFERSVVGNISDAHFVYFKHREPTTASYHFNSRHKIVLHSAIKVYTTNRGYV